MAATAAAFFCATFFVLATDCEKRKNTGWELGRERQILRRERENQIKK